MACPLGTSAGRMWTFTQIHQQFNVTRFNLEILNLGARLIFVLMTRILAITFLASFILACNRDYKVRYEVSVTPAGAQIEYRNFSENLEQATSDDNNWSYTFYMADKGQHLNLTAKALSMNATITGRIIVDDEVTETATSRGDTVQVVLFGTAK